MAKHIEVRIKGGKIELATTGFAGSECQDATKNLSKRLGVTISDTATAEMYDTPVTDELKQGA